MSTSDLYVINRRSTRWVQEFSNGWGSGPCIWDHLASKYLSEFNFTDYERSDYIGRDRKYPMIWKLGNNSSPITTEEKIALRMTFDKAFVPKAHLKIAGEACVAAHGMIEAHGFWDGVNHWRAIGEALIELSKRKFHWQARGIALSCTSVGDPWQFANNDDLDDAWAIMKEPA
jgi:hypothetical protein